MGPSRRPRGEVPFKPHRNPPELSRDRRLKVDYERLIDDVFGVTEGRSRSLHYLKSPKEAHHHAIRSSSDESGLRFYQAGTTTEWRRMREDDATSGGSCARRVGARAHAQGLVVGTVAAATLKAVGSELAITDGSCANGTASRARVADEGRRLAIAD